MASGTGQSGVFSGQREEGVVEIRRAPAVPGVARCAVVREVLLHMARGILKIGAMT